MACRSVRFVGGVVVAALVTFAGRAHANEPGARALGAVDRLGRLVSDRDEIPMIEALLAKTRVTSERHVVLMRRLAEAYYELEQTKDGEVVYLTEQIARARKAEKTDSVTELIATRAKARGVRDKSRDRVIELYRGIIALHPRYAKADEVLYFLADEYLRASEIAGREAREP